MPVTGPVTGPAIGPVAVSVTVSEQERPMWRMPPGPRRVLRLVAVVGAVLLAAALVVGVVRRPPPAPTIDGPVLTTPSTQRWDAQTGVGIAGRLTERGGCLLLGGRAVYWPRGTRWDAHRRAIVLGPGRLRRVGHSFSGGGSLSEDPVGTAAGLDRRAGARLLRCVRASGSTEVVLAYPNQR